VSATPLTPLPAVAGAVLSICFQDGSASNDDKGGSRVGSPSELGFRGGGRGIRTLEGCEPLPAFEGSG
jgi:hypothetical protein